MKPELQQNKCFSVYFIADLVSCAVKSNEINSATIMQALAGLLQHALIAAYILFYRT